MNFETLEKLLGAYEQAPIRVESTRCLNLRHKARACDACHACPADAIRFDDRAPVALDETKCVACGLCVSVCPSSAFSATPNDSAILDTLAAYPHVEFACKRAKQTRAPQIERVMTLTCLARLSGDLLFALGAEHSRVWLNDAPCVECPIGARTHPHIVALAQAARRTLAAWQRDARIMRYAEADAELGAPRELAASHTQPLSRRELFSFLRGNLGRAAGIAVAASLNVTPSHADATPALDRALAKLGAPANDCVASECFATVRVSAACTACGLCAKQCPTRAIEFRNDGGYFVLGFQAHRCFGIECRICQLICPANAVTLEPGIASVALQSREQIVLRAGQLALCVKCQTPFAQVENETQCSVCRNAKPRYSDLVRDLFKPKHDSPESS